MRCIDADELSRRMYTEAFLKDTDMQKWDSGCWIRYKLFENVLKEQPTIEPERKPGRWTHAWGTDDDIWKCSECGFEIDAHGCDPVEYLETYKFCPNCGSDNREEGDHS